MAITELLVSSLAKGIKYPSGKRGDAGFLNIYQDRSETRLSKKIGDF